MLMNFKFYVNGIRPKKEVVVSFQQIRKIKYLNATTSLHEIYCICCSETKRNLLHRRFNMVDGVSVFDGMW
jgi:hypothetical protein